MRATPIQRYALRLLFATGHNLAVSHDQWNSLSETEAAKLMQPFGGKNRIMQEIQLPKKPKTAEKTSPRRKQPPSQSIPPHDRELGE